MRTWYFSNFYFFYFATIGIIMPYWSLYLDHKGFSAKDIGQLMAIFLFTKMVAPNIWAALADRISIRNGNVLALLKVATLMAFAIYLLMYSVNGFWPVAGVMFGYCVFWNASLPQLEAATLNHLDDKRDYGRVRLWGSIGFIVTVFGVGVLMDFTGPSLMLTAGAIALGALFLSSMLMNGPSRSSELSDNEPVSLLAILDLRVLVLMFLCILMQVSHAPLQTFLSLYLLEYGYSNSQIGLLWTTGVIFEIGVFMIAFRLLEKFRLSSLLTLTFIASMIRWTLLASFPFLPIVVFVTQAMHAITFGLYHIVMIQLIDRFFVGAYQVRGQALYSSLTFGLGGAIGSFLSGYLWTDYGKQELFYLCGLLMLIVSLISLFVMPRITGETSH